MGQVEGPPGSATSLGYSLQALEVGVGLGYRFDLGGLGLAAMLGPSVAVLSQQLRDGPAGRHEVTNPKTGALMAAPGRDAPVARVGADLRATLLTSASIRVFASLDASLDVARDSANGIPSVYAGTPQLPTWSAGLSLGGQLRVWP